MPMSCFLRKTILFGGFNVRTNIPGFLRNPDFFPLRLFSTSSNKQNFTVSYLINSLGFSPQTALSVSKNVNFESNDKPDKFITLFKNYGFTQTQISSLVRIKPKLLFFDAEKIILPKLEFLEARGFSGPELAKTLSRFPTLLETSLSKQIMPAYDFFWNLFQSDKKVVAAVERYPDILVHNIEIYVAPNVAILKEHGVPDSNVVKMMHNWPRSFIVAPSNFRKAVEKMVDMGFDSSKVTFVVAVILFRSMSKSKWENKVHEFKKWGFSEEEILKAFKKYPWFMVSSEDKIKACMDFFLNQMGWRPSHIAKFPGILSLSLKKRVVPRCSVFQVLLAKGLVEKEVSLGSLLIAPEKRFLQKFIAPYEEKVPELLKLYEEKLELSKRLEIDDKV